MNWLRSIKEQRGFTLLELLIVIAIIAILASTVVANLNSARNKANDAKVRSELKSVDQAIQVYISTNKATDLAGGWTSLIAPTGKLVPTYLPKAPVHPGAKSGYVGYYYKGTVTNASDALDYTLAGKLVDSTKPCFVIKNGSAEDGDCPSGSGL